MKFPDFSIDGFKRTAPAQTRNLWLTG